MKPENKVVVDKKRLQELLKRLKSRKLKPEDYELLEGMAETWQFLCLSLEKNRLSIKRLQRILFGSKSEKSEKILSQGAKNKSPPEKEKKEKPKGHGRNGSGSYWGAKRIRVEHESQKAGDKCIKCGKGKLYELKTPSPVVVFHGEAPVQATVYECQKLRCSSCGEVFVARVPDEAGSEKYKPTTGSIVALLKYGNGFPFYRLAQLQKSLGVPLAASVQWKLVKQKAYILIPVWEELIRLAAQGKILHNDDTSMTILQLLKERSEARKQAEGQKQGKDQRTGMFTTAIVSKGFGLPHTIVLFHTGANHAGENLQELLQHRDPSLSKPILMCDALSRNLPAAFSVILANCLAHARRQFVDLIESFPEECEYLLDILKEVYQNDEKTENMELDEQERLEYHKKYSKPLMDKLHAWFKSRFEEKKVEPNSSLGQAISYMLKHWKALTLFLRKAGAPLDNNVTERALKRAILNRKNSLFYKTLTGAKVGDILMSLIYTCVLCKADPFDYLTVTEIHAQQVRKDPKSWMPWNYRNQIERLDGEVIPA